jgi:hypothetical protein
MLKNSVFDKDGKRIRFVSEDIDVIFEKPLIYFPQEVAVTKETKTAQAEAGKGIAPIITKLLPSVVDIAFQITNRLLENRVKSFTAEYSKNKSYLEVANHSIPSFTFNRTLDNQDALTIKFVPKGIDSIGMVYYVESLYLDRSSAKTMKHWRKFGHTFDYSIEIKPTFLVNGEKKVLELSPLVISSVKFGKPVFDVKEQTDENIKYKHRTDFIYLPINGYFTDISIKIVETNTLKVRAEEVLSIWNENKESAKIIINNILPKEKEDNTNNKPSDKKSAITNNKEKI